MLSEIYNHTIHFLKLTGKGEVLWTVLPLALATIIMVVYFQRYKEERPGWNDYVANSLVLLFVAMSLLREIYMIDMFGAGNYIEYPGKTISTLFLLLIGMIIVKFNFEHLLPKSISQHISSPLTTNLIAYLIILYVYSERATSWAMLFSLIILFVIFLMFFTLIKIPIERIIVKLKQMKRREEISDIKQQKFEIKELKEELKQKEKSLTKSKAKELEQEKKKVIKLKKIIRGR